MKLYYSPVTCALSPYIALLESGLPHELVVVDLKTHTLPDGSDFYAINPLGYVPYLHTDDGQGLAEGVAILQYLADQAPDKALAPANGSFARYQLQSRLNFIATELPRHYDVLFSSSATPEARTQATQTLHKHYTRLEGELAQQPYLQGEHFSVADAYLFTVTNWAKLVGLDLSGFPALQAYLARLTQRPAIQTALQVEANQGQASTCCGS